MCHSYNPREWAVKNRKLDSEFLNIWANSARWWISHQFYTEKITHEEYEKKMDEVDKKQRDKLLQIFEKHRIKPDEPDIFHK